jgi:hypothetical protein
VHGESMQPDSTPAGGRRESILTADKGRVHFRGAGAARSVFGISPALAGRFCSGQRLSGRPIQLRRLLGRRGRAGPCGNGDGNSGTPCVRRVVASRPHSQCCLRKSSIGGASLSVSRPRIRRVRARPGLIGCAGAEHMNCLAAGLAPRVVERGSRRNARRKPHG